MLTLHTNILQRFYNYRVYKTNTILQAEK